MPFEAGAFPGAGQTVLHAEGPVPQLDTVQVDNSHGPDFLVQWEAPFRGEGNSCYRLGTDDDGNSYIAVAGQEDRYLTDSHEALRNLIADIKAGKADHLL